MKKVIVIDGIDNTGKTTIAKRLTKVLQDERPLVKVEYCHFPSDELVAKFFNSTEQIENEKKSFIKELLLEIDEYFANNVANIYIIDRFVVSSLMYQSIPDDAADDMFNFIMDSYNNFFLKHGMNMNEDLIQFVNMKEFPKQEREISQENKALFDGKNDVYLKKLEQVLNRTFVTQDFDFDNITIFANDFVNVDITQKIRLQMILDDLAKREII